MHGILQEKGRIKGFTLLEILIAVFIFGILFSTIFVSYTGTFRIIEDTGSQADVYAMARIAMERILEDLGSVYVPEVESGDVAKVGMSFTGTEKEIDGVNFASLRFISMAHLEFDQGRTLPEPAEIAYVVRETGGENVLALYRSDTPMQRPSPDEGSGHLLCDGLSGFKCTYYDAGGIEHVSWGGTDAPSKEIIPAMVTIHLEFTNASNPEAPLKFRSAVALPPVGNRDESTS